MAVIETRGLAKRYGSTTALQGIDLQIEGSGVHLLAGPNGSGKSTLLSILSGAERPDSGVVRVLGLDPWREHGKLAPRISSLLDRASIPPWVRGVEVARVVAEARGADWGGVRELASLLGVDSYWGKVYGSYSSGMKRRLLLLLALVGGPEVVMVDEPFQALDRGSVARAARALAEAGRESTVLVATHVVPGALLEASVGMVILEEGRVSHTGPPSMDRLKGVGLGCPGV